MGMAMDHDRAVEAVEHRLDLGGVLRPEIPGLVVVVERRVGEDDDRGRRVDGFEVASQPLPLLGPDLETALDSVVEPGHGLHSLHGRHAALGPEILLDHAVQRDEVDPLVVERVGRVSEELSPFFAHVEIPIVLAHHHLHGHVELTQDLGPELELLRLAELGEISTIDHEIGLGVEALDVVDGAQELRDEAIVEVALVEMGVGDVGEAESASIPRRVRDGDGLERMGEAKRSGSHRGPERRRGETQEASPIEVAKPVQDLLALLMMLRLDALHASDGLSRFSAHESLSSASSESAASASTRCSKGRTRRIAMSSFRKGRRPSPSAISRWRSSSAALSSAKRRSVMLNMKRTRSSISASLSASGSMPPSRKGFGSPPLL